MKDDALALDSMRAFSFTSHLVGVESILRQVAPDLNSPRPAVRDFGELCAVGEIRGVLRATRKLLPQKFL
jgi:hypothetical protein